MGYDSWYQIQHPRHAAARFVSAFRRSDRVLHRVATGDPSDPGAHASSTDSQSAAATAYRRLASPAPLATPVRLRAA